MMGDDIPDGVPDWSHPEGAPGHLRQHLGDRYYDQQVDQAKQMTAAQAAFVRSGAALRNATAFALVVIVLCGACWSAYFGISALIG